AHDDGLVEQAGCRWHRHERRHLHPATGLPEDGHVPGIAAERRNVVPHPSEGRDEVQHAGLARAVISQWKVSERAESVIDRHDDDVLSCREPVAPEGWFGPSAVEEGAAVEP